MDNKRKAVIYVSMGIAGVILLSAFGFRTIFGTKLKVQDEVKVEVGNTVLIEPRTFCTDMSEDEMAKVNISSRLTKTGDKYIYNAGSHEVVSKGKKYLEVGTYEVNLKAGNKEATSKLIVEDTTAPVITENGSVHNCPVGTEDFDFTSLVDITDYSDFDVDISTSTVNLSKEGTYPVVFKAKDEYNNVSSLEVSLVVGDMGYVVIPTDNDTEDTETNTNDTEQTETNTGFSDWRDKYKNHLTEDDDDDDDYDSSKDKGDFGSVTDKTFESPEDAEKWIQENIMGKGEVQWTYSTQPDGSIKYEFNYGRQRN